VNERKWTHEAKHGEDYLVPLLNQSLCERRAAPSFAQNATSLPYVAEQVRQVFTSGFDTA
jgi:hypothetical protein